MTRLRERIVPIVAAVAASAGYVVAFPALFQLFGVTAAVGTVAPVVLVGWSFGARWGTLAGLLTIPANALAFGQLGITYADEPLRSGLIPGTIGWTVVGYLVGSARQLAQRSAHRAASLAVALDERTRAEAALRAERDRSEMLLEAQSALGEAVLLGRGERIEWANDAVLAMSRRTMDDLRALPSVFDLVAPADQLALRAALSGRSGSRETVTIVRNDGSTLPVELAVRGIRLEDGDRGFALVARDVTDRIEAEAILRRHAQEDALTGLASRGHLQRQLTEMLATEAAVVAVLLLDLDGFKAVNDRYGHAAGDQVLRIVARRLQGQIREGDVLGRLGGDEFVVLAPGASRASAEAIASRVRAAIARPLRVGDVGCAVGASVGVAVAPDDGTTTEALLHQADMAMYEAKRARPAPV